MMLRVAGHGEVKGSPADMAPSEDLDWEDVVSAQQAGDLGRGGCFGDLTGRAALGHAAFAHDEHPVG